MTIDAVQTAPAPAAATTAGGIPTTDASELSPDLRMATLHLARRIRQERADDELSPGQSAVLAYLVRKGATTPGELSVYEHVSPPSMNRTLNALQLAGYIARSPSDSDRRMVLVDVTAAGREVVIATRRQRDAWLERRLAALSPADREALASATAIMQRLVAE